MRDFKHLILWQLGLAQAETQTSLAERDCLASHAAGKKRLVEVGVWHGVTTCRLRQAMSSEGVLLGVDPYRPGRLGFSIPQRIAHAEVSKVRNGIVQWSRMTGAEAASEYAYSGAPPVDFVFIDGDHSYEGLRADWEGWSPLVASDGIIALHDSQSSETRKIDDAGSAVFTREVIRYDSRFDAVEVVDTLTVLKRVASF